MCSQEFPSFVFRCDDLLLASDSFYRVSFLVFVRCRGLSWTFSFFVSAGYGAICLRSLVLKAVSSPLGSEKFCSPVFVCGRSPFHLFLSSSVLCVWLRRIFGVAFFCSGALVVCRLSFPGA